MRTSTCIIRKTVFNIKTRKYKRANSRLCDQHANYLLSEFDSPCAAYRPTGTARSGNVYWPFGTPKVGDDSQVTASVYRDENGKKFVICQTEAQMMDCGIRSPFLPLFTTLPPKVVTVTLTPELAACVKKPLPDPTPMAKFMQKKIKSMEASPKFPILTEGKRNRKIS